MKKGMTNKIFILSIFSLFLLSLLSVGVLAQEDALEQAAEVTGAALTGTAKIIGEVLAPLFGDKEMLSRVFFAILLGMIIYTIISSFFKGGKSFTLLSTVAITGLALIAIPSNFLEAIRVSYGAMGAAILTAIPFLIVVVFSVNVRSKLVAQAVWLFFMLYYFVLYANQLIILGFSKEVWLSGKTLPYVAAILAGFILFWVIGGVRGMIWKGKLEALEEHGMKDIEFRKLGRKLGTEEAKARTE